MFFYMDFGNKLRCLQNFGKLFEAFIFQNQKAVIRTANLKNLNQNQSTLDCKFVKLAKSADWIWSRHYTRNCIFFPWKQTILKKIH